jgi:hypothetical protein
MGVKGLAIVAVLCVLLQAPLAVTAQTGNHASAKSQTPPASSSTSAEPQSAGSENEGIARDLQPPHITVANPPAPAPAPWSLHEQISWAANLVLVLLGYVGIMMAVSLLKKIARQTAYTEAAADAAATSAQAALLSAQAVLNSERPWILITVEPSRSLENSFTVMATNRGRTPARIIETMDRNKIVIDEKRLPATPEFRNVERSTPFTPIILLPGEFTAIKPFSRDDVKGLCDSEERFKRIETWEEKVYLYGKVLYRDLISPADSPAHETNWCCWYIHGRQNSGLVIAGPPEYNSHT